MRWDPSFFEDERWERLGADALVLHLAAVSYTVRTLSDGVMSQSRVRVLTPLVKRPEAVARRLVDDGVWTELDGGALRVCDVRDDLRHSDGRGDEQPSRKYVEAERERAKQRKDKWRAKQGTRSGTRSEQSRSSADRTEPVQDLPGPGPAPVTHQECEHGRPIAVDGYGCERCHGAGPLLQRVAG